MDREVTFRDSYQEAKQCAKPVLPFGHRVVLAIGECRTVKQTSKLFKVSRQRVEYHVKKGLNVGWLRKEGDYPATYYLTEIGKQTLLKRDEGFSRDGRLNIRAHGACLKFPIMGSPDEASWQRFKRDSHEVPLKNWISRHTDCGGLKVAVSNRNVLIWVSSIWIDSDHFKERTVLSCMSAAQEVAAIMCSKYGFKLDVLHPEFVTTPQYALPDLFTDDGEKVRLSFRKGAIDYSKGFRELEYTDARHLSDFLAMPERLKRVENLLEKGLRQRQFERSN